ncbi:MAG: hypothetical protein HC763_29895 [Hydrococcus sp. CRU_1_1]|nr:hypothetical protein [Hydrococcus sp. CRU_1_1]
MNIAAINDTLFPVVLFVIYFCFVSVVRYNLKDKANVSYYKEVSKTSQAQSKPFTYRDAFSAAFDPDPVPEIAEEIMTSNAAQIVEEAIAPISPVLTDDKSIDAPITTPLNQPSIPEIIDRLSKRDIRKLCSPLGIQQKTNGTELTTELMKAVVKRKFKENPHMVVEVMSVRFPDLLSTLSIGEQQQQLEKKAC